MKHKKRLVGCDGIEIGVGGRCGAGEMGVMLSDGVGGVHGSGCNW